MLHQKVKISLYFIQKCFRIYYYPHRYNWFDAELISQLHIHCMFKAIQFQRTFVIVIVTSLLLSLSLQSSSSGPGPQNVSLSLQKQPGPQNVQPRHDLPFPVSKWDELGIYRLYTDCIQTVYYTVTHTATTAQQFYLS